MDASQTFYTSLGLKCGTRYQFYLIAYNKQGRGEQSETISCKTDGGLPVAPDKKSALSVNMSSVAVKLDSWHNGGCQIIGFRIRYKLHGAKEWTQVSADPTGQQANGGSLDGSSPDLHTSNAQQLSTNSLSNSISLLGTGYYPLPKEMSGGSLLGAGGGLPSVININDLKPDRKYQIQVSAINSVGSTDAEYNVNTYSVISNELMRSSNRLLQHGQQLSAQLADYTYLLPVCLSLMIITVLLLMVCVVVKRGNQVPNASTSLLYGSIVGNNHKEEQLQMANFATSLSNKQKQMKCDGNGCDANMGHLLITANGTICETMPKLNNNGQLVDGQHTGLEPLYATVKRTPRTTLRTAGDSQHIYSYPVQSMNGGNHLTTAMNTLNNLNTMNAINTAMNMGGLNGHHLSNGYSNNGTYSAFNPSCNGNSCNGGNLNSNDQMNGCSIGCNQTILDNSCNMMGQCTMDDKLLTCPNSDPYGNSSCNTSMNSGQLMNNGGCNGNKMICSEHDQMMELGLCQMMR